MEKIGDLVTEQRMKWWHTLKLGEGATSQGIQVSNRSWKKARKQILISEPPKGTNPVQTLIFSLNETDFEHLTSRSVREKSFMF